MTVSGVRLARTSDVDDIARINVASWRGRFAGVLPDATLAGLDAADLASTWASGILNPPLPAQRLLVAVEDDVLVGYAAWGPCQDPDAVDGTGELIALEVDPTRTRQGHASRLPASTLHARPGPPRPSPGRCCRMRSAVPSSSRPDGGPTPPIGT
jgi:GNAT superfamily N-acetyltransferase